MWRDYVSETVENQYKFAVPLNRDTEKIFYNLRLIIDNRVETEPLSWRVTKVNRIAPNGVARITLAQDQFEPHTDYIEKDNDGNIIGMWADYYDNGNVIPKEPDPFALSVYSEISCTGDPVLKMRGTSYKKFTVNFYREEELINFKTGEWTFGIKKKSKDPITPIEPSQDFLLVKMPNEASDLDDNQIKIKLKDNMKYLNWILVITYTETEDDKNITSNIEVNISRL